MRVLVVGASGMLGHKVVLMLRDCFDVVGFVRRGTSALPRPLQAHCRTINATPDALAQACAALSPDYIINCAGVVKQRDTGKSLAAAYVANVVLPLELDRVATEFGARMIHISTDCVFEGETRGRRPFTLDDVPSAHDTYGASKRAGELVATGSMTLRTSIVGPELYEKTGLLEWAFSRRGQRVFGFQNAVFSGVPTVTLARLIAEIIQDDKWRPGLWQVATEPVNKADWLEMVNANFNLGLTIARNTDFYCDRTLDGTGFDRLLGRKLPSWIDLMREMHADYLSNTDIYQGR